MKLLNEGEERGSQSFISSRGLRVRIPQINETVNCRRRVNNKKTGISWRKGIYMSLEHIDRLSAASRATILPENFRVLYPPPSQALSQNLLPNFVIKQPKSFTTIAPLIQSASTFSFSFSSSLWIDSHFISPLPKTPPPPELYNPSPHAFIPTELTPIETTSWNTSLGRPASRPIHQEPHQSSKQLTNLQTPNLGKSQFRNQNLNENSLGAQTTGSLQQTERRTSPKKLNRWPIRYQKRY